MIDVFFAEARKCFSLGNYAEAASAFQRVLELDSSCAAAWLGRGKVSIAMGAHEDAIESLRRCLALRAENHEALLCYGTALHYQGLHQKALKKFEDALKLEPKCCETRLKHAVALMDLQQYERAVECLDVALTFDCNVPETHYERALGLSRLGRKTEALDSFSQALSMRPDFALAWYERAKLLYELKEYGEAANNLERYLGLRSGDHGSFLWYAQIQWLLNNHTKAIAACDRAEALDSSRHEWLVLRGKIAETQRDYDGALEYFRRAIQINCNCTEALTASANICRRTRRAADALAYLNAALDIDPASTSARLQRANCFVGLARWHDALRDVETIIQVGRCESATHILHGDILKELSRVEDAVKAYDMALATNPACFSALASRGKCLVNLGRHEQALVDLNAALELRPKDATLSLSKALALSNLGHLDEAIIVFETYLANNETDFGAWTCYVRVLGAADRPTDTKAVFEKMIGLWPKKISVYLEFASVLHHYLGDSLEAIAQLDTALAVEPNSPAVLCLGAWILASLSRHEEAEKKILDALTIEPKSTDLLVCLGELKGRKGHRDEAVQCYSRALEIDGNCVAALLARISAYSEGVNHLAAIKDLRHLISINPDVPFARGDLLLSQLQVARWQRFNDRADRLINDVRAGKPVISPFSFFGLSKSPSDALKCAQTICQMVGISRSNITRSNREFKVARHQGIRVGYVSGEFRDHATSHLAGELFESHDRRNFTIFAFHNGKDDDSEFSRKIRHSFDEFVNISHLPRAQAVEEVLKSEIDILVDLNGHCGRPRRDLFLSRSAPVQVNYLGFPGTTANPNMDYIIADRVVIPEDDREYYSEAVVYLPNSYQANDTRRALGSIKPSRSACGLPDNSFVFASFNAVYKIQPDMFSVWMRILKRAPGSVLWLLADNKHARRNLAEEAERRGIDSQRLVFAGTLSADEHLARMGIADLLLDILPCNGHTTTSDALWAGLPVVTCLGPTFPGRVAASLLNAVGMSELVTSNLQDYEDLAVKLALDRGSMTAIRQKLAANRTTTPLFDSPSYIRHLEFAYSRMMERYNARKRPESFYVPETL